MQSYTYSSSANSNENSGEDSSDLSDDMRDDVCCDPSHPCCTPTDPVCRRIDPYCKSHHSPTSEHKKTTSTSSHYSSSHHSSRHHPKETTKSHHSSGLVKHADNPKSHNGEHRTTSLGEKTTMETHKYYEQHSISNYPNKDHHESNSRIVEPAKKRFEPSPELNDSGYSHHETPLVPSNASVDEDESIESRPKVEDQSKSAEGRSNPVKDQSEPVENEPKSADPAGIDQPSHVPSPAPITSQGRESIDDHRLKHQSRIRLTTTADKKNERSSNTFSGAPYRNVSDTSYNPEDPSCNPDHPTIVTFEEITSAAYRIKSGIVNTSCTKSHMSNLTGMDIYLKKDFEQNTGSFKERGARYAMLMLSPENKQKGVIAASLGNHAQAVCYHGMLLAIPVTVVMPIIAPIMKMQKCKEFNATVIMEGRDMAEAKKIAIRLAKERDLTYINGYDHPQIIAGQGTIALEIMEQVDKIDAVVVPTGGGGLLAGVGVAVKTLNPNIKLIGVESERCASFAKAMEAEKPIFTEIRGTLADGLAVPMVGYNAWATAKKLVDKVVVVKEEWIAVAILRLVELEKCVVEGAGAVGLAAILAGQLDEFKGKRVVLILSGGNIDTTILGRCLERGLAADGRLVKCKVTVSDRPGGISELCKLIGSIGVSIKDVIHERAWVASDVFSVEVKVVCETRDYAHSLELRDLLFSRYKKVKFDNLPQHAVATSDVDDDTANIRSKDDKED